jgi:hypothetical protein
VEAVEGITVVAVELVAFDARSPQLVVAVV